MAKQIERIAPQDLIVWRSAQRIVRRRGASAIGFTRDVSNSLAFEGDERGAKTWRKTTQAVEWLLANPESMDLLDHATLQ